jgi:hypothetical protein
VLVLREAFIVTVLMMKTLQEIIIGTFCDGAILQRYLTGIRGRIEKCEPNVEEYIIVMIIYSTCGIAGLVSLLFTSYSTTTTPPPPFL